MKTSPPLSTFDRIGVAVVALPGSCLGWEGLAIATANDVSSPPSITVILPGALIGFVMAHFVGIKVAGIASAVPNGAIYGLLMYGWNRFASRISVRGRRA
jgi:hypothetical protein